MTTEVDQLRDWADRQGPLTTSAIARALTLAEQAHRGQFRRSGDPYRGVGRVQLVRGRCSNAR